MNQNSIPIDSRVRIDLFDINILYLGIAQSFPLGKVVITLMIIPTSPFLLTIPSRPTIPSSSSFINLPFAFFPRQSSPPYFNVWTTKSYRI